MLKWEMNGGRVWQASIKEDIACKSKDICRIVNITNDVTEITGDIGCTIHAHAYTNKQNKAGYPGRQRICQEHWFWVMNKITVPVPPGTCAFILWFTLFVIMIWQQQLISHDHLCWWLLIYAHLTMSWSYVSPVRLCIFISSNLLHENSILGPSYYDPGFYCTDSSTYCVNYSMLIIYYVELAF